MVIVLKPTEASTQAASTAAIAPRVLVIDRQPLMVHALSRVFSGPPLSAWVVAATESSEAVSAVTRDHLELVCCDIRATPISGPQLAKALVEASADARVILLGEAEDAGLLIDALGCGASGFFTKDASPDEFVEGVVAVLAGHLAIGQTLLPLTLARLAGTAPSEPAPPGDQLSPSQRAILVMVGKAQSIADIASARHISQKTVRNHLTNIYRKLALRNRAEAILWAARMGLTAEMDGRD